MKVLKFGGTSVGTIESLSNVKKIVESIPGKAVVVVSALGGLTDKLISTAKMAEAGNKSWQFEMEAISFRHFDIISKMVASERQETVKDQIGNLLSELERNYEGVYLLKSLPEKVLDIIVSFGERMSSVIVAEIIDNAKRYYSPDFIKTEKWYGKNIADSKLTENLITNTFKTLGEIEKAIVPGFISTDSTTGEITNLGRGGSDYTAALIAAALDAELLEIWTDVDGFMTADPRIVKNALIIDHLTFTESMELCTFGAKVIYPPTIYPVFHKNIAIKILNTFNPGAPGTLVTDNPQKDDFEVKGVTCLKDVAIVTIPLKNEENKAEFSRRAFNILSRQAVRIIPVVTPEPVSDLIFALAATDAATSLNMLESEFAPEINTGKVGFPALKLNMAAIAVVGKDMKSKDRLGARIGHSLRRQGINVNALSTENSDTTFIYIIDQEKSNEALPLIHSLIY